jgi:cytochrome P450
MAPPRPRLTIPSSEWLDQKTVTQASRKNTVWDPFDLVDIEDPYPSYRLLRDEHPVYFNPERNFWAISRYDDVDAVVPNFSVFSHRDGIDLDGTASTMGDGNLLEADPPKHTALRKFARSYITPKRFLSLEPLVRKLLDDAAERLESVPEFDAVTELCWPLPRVIASSLLGLTDEQTRIADHLIREALHREAGRVDLSEAAVQAALTLRDYFLEIVRERRQSPGEDFISAVAVGSIEGVPISDEQALGMLMLVWTAGLETTAGMLSTIFYHLGNNPAARADLLANTDLIPNAFEEFLRFDGSIQNVARTTMEDFTLHGVTIPQGSRVTLVYGAANRDERHFNEPDKLDFRRKIGRHFGFSQGLHACIGAPSARMIGRLVMTDFLPRLGEYGVGQRQVRYVKQNLRGFETLDLVH